jgi:NitT/TauT family transport system substrate-binding protein
MKRRDFVAGFSFATGALTIGSSVRAAGQPWNVNVVAAESFYHSALYYAVDNNLFENAGIHIDRLQQGLPGKDVIQGFASGSFDLAVTGVPPQGVFWARGIPIKVLMYLGHSEQTEVLALKPGINKPDDLRGKVMAVSGIGSMSEVYSNIALRFSGIDAHKDTVLKPMNQAQMVQLAALGQLDAVAVWPPYTTLIRRDHPDAKVVVNAVDAWKKQYHTRRGAPSHGLVVRQAALDEHRPQVKAFAQALYAGVQAVRGKPQLIADEISKHEKLERDVILASMKESPPQFSDGLEQQDEENALRVWELMAQMGYSDKPVSRDIFLNILKT